MGADISRDRSEPTDFHNNDGKNDDKERDNKDENDKADSDSDGNAKDEEAPSPFTTSIQAGLANSTGSRHRAVGSVRAGVEAEVGTKVNEPGTNKQKGVGEGVPFADPSRSTATRQQPPPLARRPPLLPWGPDKDRPMSWLTAVADTATATTARFAVPVPTSVPASAGAVAPVAAPHVVENRMSGRTVKIPISISWFPPPPGCAPAAEDVQERLAGVSGLIGSSSGSQQQGQGQGKSSPPFRGYTGLELEIEVCRKPILSLLHASSV